MGRVLEETELPVIFFSACGQGGRTQPRETSGQWLVVSGQWLVYHRVCVRDYARQSLASRRTCPAGKAGRRLRRPAAAGIFRLRGASIVSIRFFLCQYHGKTEHAARGQRHLM